MPDSRVEKEAWTLQKAGYYVHILAWDRNGKHSAQDGNITVMGESISITWLGYEAGYGEGLKSLQSYLQFQIHMHRWLIKHKNDYDIIHACDFDTAFFSQTVAKNKVFVFDIFDFLYGDPVSFFQKMIYKAQIKIINHADATIICTEDRKKQIADAKPNRLTIIHNTPIKTLLDKKSNELKIESSTQRIKIAYVGILATKRLLLEMGSAIAHNKDVELHIAGFGIYDTFFEQLSKENDNVFYYGRIPYDQTLVLESSCDIMTAIYDPTLENHRFAAPNKFYESLMLGKPIIMVKGTGMSVVVLENDIGVLIDYSQDGFEKGIKELVKRKNEWPEMSDRMIRLYEEKYSWEKMGKRLTNLYAEL